MEKFQYGDRIGTIQGAKTPGSPPENLVGVVINPETFNRFQQSSEAATTSLALQPGIDWITNQKYQELLESLGNDSQ